jgi:hypothetical protein
MQDARWTICTMRSGSIKRWATGLFTLVSMSGARASTMGETNVSPTIDSGNGNLLCAQVQSRSQFEMLQSWLLRAHHRGKLAHARFRCFGPQWRPREKARETAKINPIMGLNVSSTRVSQ